MRDLVTFRLNRNGNRALVLARLRKGEPEALTYANRAQAQKAAGELATCGIACSVKQFMGRPFYVVIDEGGEGGK